ncbi:MAG: tripartite tricarboxylate transporter TctB family protein [Pseudorhodoplanes sp.]|uniref:tripartite tricarboxylate transporter TctB family protein n=1 Tax=Pseudorhodoplanes sp. TaxID=1934341 RepID=UPI003D0E2F5D
MTAAVSGLRNQRVAGAALSLIGIVSIGLSLQYPLGDATEPGPAYYPLILSVLLTAFGAVVAWRADESRLDISSWWENGRPLAILVVLAAATLALEHLGFRLTVAAVLVVLLGALERRDWRVVLPIAVLFPVATYALLHNALKINLPLGPFGI